MFNLLSKRFSDLKDGSYVDMKRNNQMPDIEEGGETEMSAAASSSSAAAGPTPSLEHFFEEMERVRRLLSDLQTANEEGKTITRAQAMKELRDRMDRTIRDILRQTKAIKTKLEDLDRSNLNNRKIPGCEAGTSTDRTRMSITVGLRSTLKGLMQDFQDLRQAMVSEYRETIDRRYYTITGVKADEETLDHMIETGESETFLQRAVQEQGRGNLIEAIKEIQERHDAVKEVERSLVELHQIFLDMSVLVESQGEQLNSIEASIQGASSFVHKGTEQLEIAKKHQSNTRKWTCILIILLLIIVIIVVAVLLAKFLPSSSSSSSSSSSPSPPPPPPPPSSG
jgi:syntaxin 1B/2/3